MAALGSGLWQAMPLMLTFVAALQLAGTCCATAMVPPAPCGPERGGSSPVWAFPDGTTTFPDGSPPTAATAIGWLEALQSAEVLTELQELAQSLERTLQDDAAQQATASKPALHRSAEEVPLESHPASSASSGFTSHHLDTSLVQAGGNGGWATFPLLNKGRFLRENCAFAPQTCETLLRLMPHLAPTVDATEVGVRLNRLAPGAKLRRHCGPGHRLVAHLGVAVPDGAALEVAGHQISWVEGGITVFDDEFPHSAVNNNDTMARLILVLAFPRPSPHGVAVTPDANLAPAVAVVTTRYFVLSFFANCTAQTRSMMGDGRTSTPVPIVELYNRVADNLPSDIDACTEAVLVGGTNDTLRLTAAHGYGTIDVQLKPFGDSVILRVTSMREWKADPTNTHIVFGVYGTGMLDPTKAPFVSGKFQGQRGAEGQENSSTGFFTMSTVWQSYNTLFYGKELDELAFTFCPTAALPEIRKQLAAYASGSSPPNPNSARVWYWASSTSELNLDVVINRTKTLGAELVFFTDITSNLGDFQVDSARFPSGFKAAASRLTEAGLLVGIHMISPGAQRGVSAAAKNRPELFVPQGPGPRSYYAASDAGTWWCHEQEGTVCHDLTRPATTGPGHPIPAPPPNHMNLSSGVTWSTLGVYRGGGALGFDGNRSFGVIRHTPEYDFGTEFTLQMVVHPLDRTPGSRQVLASMADAWRLEISEEGTPRWNVCFAEPSGDTWWSVTGTTVLQQGTSYVLKATCKAGVIKIHVCPIQTQNVGSADAPVFVTHRCNMTTEGTNGTAGGTPANSTAPIVVGAIDVPLLAAPALFGFVGALEEIYLAKVSLEDADAMVWSDPATGCTNLYIYDYTNPAARAFWANKTASLLNLGSAVTSQWDGAEFQPSTAAWDFPHSGQTFNSGLYQQPGGWRPLWGGATLQAFTESRALWNQDTAVEASFLPPGLAPWRAGDMTPFADEQYIQSDMCIRGQEWHREILLKIAQTGTVYNAYNCPLRTLVNESWTDCFLGGLVCAGIAPQVADFGPMVPTPLDERVSYWNLLARKFGHASEDSVEILHYDDIFWITMSGGSSPFPHFGLYVAADVAVHLPLLGGEVNNATIVVFASTNTSSGNISVGVPTDTTLRFFAASDVQLEMHGGWWDLRNTNVRAQRTFLNGSTTSDDIFPSPVTGQESYTATLDVGTTIVFSKIP